MNLLSLLGALLGGCLAASLLLLVSSLQRRVPGPVQARVSIGERWARLTRRPAGRAGRQRDLRVAGVVAAAFATFAVTGWVVVLLIIPTAVLLVPWLLSNPNTAAIARTAALEDWVRSLRSLLQGGSDNTLEAVLRASLRTAPEPIRAEVAALVARLNARWPADRALARFADDLADPTADTVAAALMLASRRRGYGLADVLEGLAEAVGDEVRARRRIESDRGESRATARYLTYLFGAIGVAYAVLNPAFLEPYRSAVGQTILAVIVIGYLGALLLLRRITTVQDRPRVYPVAADRGASHAA